MPTAQQLEATRRRLREDYEFYPAEALQIITKAGEVIPFVLKRPQRRLARALAAQREAGLPQRAVVLKARQVGYSTQSQGILIQRATQIPNHLAMTVAHDGDSSAEIFDIGRGMWQRLPAQIRPELAYERNTDRNKYMQFGESSRMLRQQGIVGLNSRYRVQTAGTARTTAKGRGMTIHSLHLSEVAFWDAIGRRTALANAVPDDPWSLILEESTAKGHNAFKDDWDAAVDGSSGYFACFTPWFEEETYRRRFANEIHQGEFEAALGGGPYGEDEPELLRLIPEKLREWAAEFGERISDAEVQQRTIEHLHWRRYAIPAKCSSDLQVFHAEYPSTPEEAFIATGRRVFKAQFVARVLANVKHTDPVVPTAESPGPVSGALRGAEHKLVRAERGIAIQVPQKALWVPRSQLADHETGRWRIWQAPQLESVIDGQRVPAGQYVVACDPMSGEENEGELAEHGISVIDHRTLRQVAEYSSRDEPDQVALELLLVALLYNRALIAVEKTGGWGYPIIARLARGYRYPRMFSADVPDKRILHHLERLGWSTDPATKPMMIARGEELLRTETDGIRSRKLASQMLTYVYDDRGRANPEPKKLADVLLSWLIVQRVAEITPIKPDRPRGATHYSGATTTTRPRRTKVKAREGDAW